MFSRSARCSRVETVGNSKLGERPISSPIEPNPLLVRNMYVFGWWSAWSSENVSQTGWKAQLSQTHLSRSSSSICR